MLAVAHEAKLDQHTIPDDPKSPTRRTSIEAQVRARKVDRSALDGPAVPLEFAHLLDWSRTLHGRSGIGMSGVAPLRPSEIVAWAHGSGHNPTPAEFEALLFLDSVRRDPTIVDRLQAAQALSVDDDTTPKLSAAERWAMRGRKQAAS